MMNSQKFYISISTTNNSEVAKGIEECKDFNKTLIDLEVSEEFFQSAANGSVISLASKINEEDSCEVNIILQRPDYIICRYLES